MPKIFISHSIKDKKIVEEFVDTILKLGLKIKSTNIYCSSLASHGTHSNGDWLKSIKRKIKTYDLVIFILSKDFLKSEICLIEMGAAWIRDKDTILLTVENMNLGKLKYLYNTKKIEDLRKGSNLDNFKDTMSKQYGIKLVEVSEWNGHKNDFLSQGKKFKKPGSNSKKIKTINKANKLSEKEMIILRTIYTPPAYSLSPPIISSKSNIRKPAADILIQGLVQKKYLKNVGSDLQLEEKAVKLLEGIE